MTIFSWWKNKRSVLGPQTAATLQPQQFMADPEEADEDDLLEDDSEESLEGIWSVASSNE